MALCSVTRRKASRTRLTTAESAKPSTAPRDQRGPAQPAQGQPGYASELDVAAPELTRAQQRQQQVARGQRHAAQHRPQQRGHVVAGHGGHGQQRDQDGIGGQRQRVGEPLDADIDRGQRDAERADEGERRHVRLAAEAAEQQRQHPGGGKLQDQRGAEAASAAPAPDDGPAAHRGGAARQVVRSGSPLTTDSRKTVPLSAAPASRPATAPLRPTPGSCRSTVGRAPGKRGAFGRGATAGYSVGRPVLLVSRSPDMSSAWPDFPAIRPMPPWARLRHGVPSGGSGAARPRRTGSPLAVLEGAPMLKFFVSLQNFLAQPLRRDDRGATAVEYGLIVALIAAAIVAGSCRARQQCCRRVQQHRNGTF